MARAHTLTTSLWSLVEAMQTCLEGEGLEPAAIDAEVTRGLQSFLYRESFGEQRRRQRRPVSEALPPLVPGR